MMTCSHQPASRRAFSGCSRKKRETKASLALRKPVKIGEYYVHNRVPARPERHGGEASGGGYLWRRRTLAGKRDSPSCFTSNSPDASAPDACLGPRFPQDPLPSPLYKTTAHPTAHCPTPPPDRNLSSETDVTSAKSSIQDPGALFPSHPLDGCRHGAIRRAHAHERVQGAEQGDVDQHRGTQDTSQTDGVHRETWLTGAQLINENVFEWSVALIVLNPDSLYYGGYFKAKLTFPKTYPYQPPGTSP